MCALGYRYVTIMFSCHSWYWTDWWTQKRVSVIVDGNSTPTVYEGNVLNKHSNTCLVLISKILADHTNVLLSLPGKTQHKIALCVKTGLCLPRRNSSHVSFLALSALNALHMYIYVLNPSQCIHCVIWPWEVKGMALFKGMTEDMTKIIKDMAEDAYVFGPEKFYSSSPKFRVLITGVTMHMVSSHCVQNE